MEIQRVGVVGAGTMGHGIAQVAAQAGYATVVHDVDARALEAARERIAENLARGVEKGKVDRRDAARVLERIETGTGLEILGRADLVIEAVPERAGLKRRVLEAVGEVVDPSAVVATNTSSLRIAELATVLPRPERFLGMHFFNPVHLMELLEIVAHEGTAPDVVELARRAGEAMGKTPIVVRDVPGFATSRLGVLLGLEAMRMVEEGVASAADIDTAMKLGYRHPMGPLELTDLVGLDVRLDIAEYLHRELGREAYRPPDLLREMVREGKLGKKAGEGFYRW